MKKSTFSEKNSTIHTDAVKKLFGSNGQIYVYNDKVFIEREGTAAKLAFPFAKPITIPMTEIDMVNVGESGSRGEGYVQIRLKSNNGFLKAIQNVEEDRYAVMTCDNASIFEMKQFINEQIGR